MSDDTFTEIADHVITTLQADTELGSGGGLAITTFERQFREDVGDWSDHELPAISVRCNHGGEIELQSIGEVRNGYVVEMIVTVAGGKLQAVLDSVNEYSARIIRVMDQQHVATKQLSSLPADLDGGAGADLECFLQSYEADGVPSGNRLRGAGFITYVVFIDIETPID